MRTLAAGPDKVKRVAYSEQCIISVTLIALSVTNIGYPSVIIITLQIVSILHTRLILSNVQAVSVKDNKPMLSGFINYGCLGMMLTFQTNAVLFIITLTLSAVAVLAFIRAANKARSVSRALT